MKELAAQPRLVEQVHEAILADISAGTLVPGTRIIQEQVARDLGVSRQPVQQALLLLHNQGVLRDAPGRGLIVTRLDPDYVQSMYEIRAVIEGLACRKAAEINAARAAKEGPPLIAAGRLAVRSASFGRMIAADLAFHRFIYALSENRLIAPAMEPHWVYTRRVMGEVLIRDERPRDIWDQHEVILDAIAGGRAAAADKAARTHITQAASFMLTRLRTEPDAPTNEATEAPAGRARKA
jgi:DNA-binding GntR family transcriptional regulator